MRKRSFTVQITFRRRSDGVRGTPIRLVQTVKTSGTVRSGTGYLERGQRSRISRKQGQAPTSRTFISRAGWGIVSTQIVEALPPGLLRLLLLPPQEKRFRLDDLGLLEFIHLEVDRRLPLGLS